MKDYTYYTLNNTTTNISSYNLNNNNIYNNIYESVYSNNNINTNINNYSYNNTYITPDNNIYQTYNNNLENTFIYKTNNNSNNIISQNNIINNICNTQNNQILNNNNIISYNNKYHIDNNNKKENSINNISYNYEYINKNNNILNNNISYINTKNESSINIDNDPYKKYNSYNFIHTNNINNDAYKKYNSNIIIKTNNINNDAYKKVDSKNSINSNDINNNEFKIYKSYNILSTNNNIDNTAYQKYYSNNIIKNNNTDNNNNAYQKNNSYNIKKINNTPLFKYSKTQNKNSIQSSETNLEKKDLSKDQTTINLVLENTVEQFFVLKDFFKLKSEKDIINYFYEKEKLCLEWLNKNIPKEDYKKKFFTNLITKTITRVYEDIEEFSKIRKKIRIKINNILEEIETKKKYSNLEVVYQKTFGVKNLPKFLSNEIHQKIENILYLEKYKRNFEQMNNIYELNQMLIYYNGFLNGEKRPFNSGHDNVDLFMILLYSNLKDIYKSTKIKKIFVDNFDNLISIFNIVYFDQSKFYSIINNVNLNFNENEVLNVYFFNYKKIQNFQIHLHVLSSYFYFIVNTLKDTNDKYNTGAFINIGNRIEEININNPLMGKILRNVYNTFAKYSPYEQLKPNIYPYLIQLLYNHIIIEDNKKHKEINKIYEISDIQNIVNKSPLADVKNEKIDILLRKLNNVESSNISIERFLTKIKEIFLISEQKEMEVNKISLSPLNLNRNSNLITIFISGFGSERENIYSWRNFIDFEPKFSNFYFYKWPSGNFAEMISIIPFSDKFVLEIPGKFINYKLKGKLVGKILGLFLASNEDFKKCQINLVGFSLGCHVIKYCIKEIAKIKGVRNMINNVLFMAGAASIGDKKNWKHIFKKVVGGRIINCYSEHDFVLDKLFKLCVDHTAIGTRPLIIKDESNKFNMVENYDFSDIELGHLDYRKNFGKILKRINFY